MSKKLEDLSVGNKNLSYSGQDISLFIEKAGITILLGYCIYESRHCLYRILGSLFR